MRILSLLMSLLVSLCWAAVIYILALKQVPESMGDFITALSLWFLLWVFFDSKISFIFNNIVHKGIEKIKFLIKRYFVQKV